jgi:hypothetical protein
MELGDWFRAKSDLPLGRHMSLARPGNRLHRCSSSEASLLSRNELLAQIRHSPPVWIASFMAEPKSPSRHFARASPPPSRRGRRMSAIGFAKLHRI